MYCADAGSYTGFLPGKNLPKKRWWHKNSCFFNAEKTGPLYPTFIFCSYSMYFAHIHGNSCFFAFNIPHPSFFVNLDFFRFYPQYHRNPPVNLPFLCRIFTICNFWVNVGLKFLFLHSLCVFLLPPYLLLWWFCVILIVSFTICAPWNNHNFPSLLFLIYELCTE